MRLASCACALLALAACMPEADVGRSAPALMADGGDTAPVMDPAMADGSRSQIIGALEARRSVLRGGAFADIADAVLASNARAAEAELRAARLRSEARASNWLPTIGPDISLTSLGDVVASLVVDAVLFDNGRKKAERAYARADVEVAAVGLAQDTNDRVKEALDLYIDAQEARAKAAANAEALTGMERYAYIMDERVRGGVSTRVEAQVIHQKLTRMRSELARDREDADTAMAELSAMASRSLAGIEGLSDLDAELTATPLSVLKAKAEAARDVAEARAARAGLLPGLSGAVNHRGEAGLSVGGGIGFGTGASLAAATERETAARARVDEAQEETGREIQSLQARLAALDGRIAQARTLADQTRGSFTTFAQQQREGQRGVPEVVSTLETHLRAERDWLRLRHDAARIAIEIAALRGVLVDGDKI